MLGFAFLPAGLKKLYGEPFTDPANTGAFHEFLHAFHATGAFYNVVGAVQVAVALLLMTQRQALLGAAMALPLFTAIGAFCWSTDVPFTATMVTLMWLGTLFLLMWDAHRLAPLFGRQYTFEESERLIDKTVWAVAGLLVFVVYSVIVFLSGGVYRPRGVELDNPSFYVLPLLVAILVGAYVVERRRRKRAHARS